MRISQSLKTKLISKYGKFALITGATSGIGLSIAETLAKAGMNLVLVSRNLEQLKSLKNQFEGKHKIEVEVFAIDLSKENSTIDLINQIQHLQIGLVVLSAGFGTSGLFSNSKLQNELDMLKVNCQAVLELTHYFTQKFVLQKRGGIILMSSIAGFHGVPYSAHYSATKAYIQTLVEGMYPELKRQNVNIIAAALGPFKSGFLERAIMNFGGLMMNPDDLAIPILKALGNKSTVFPGFLSKLIHYSLAVLPRWAKIKVMQLVMKGMTG